MQIFNNRMQFMDVREDSHVGKCAGNEAHVLGHLFRRTVKHKSWNWSLLS